MEVITYNGYSELINTKFLVRIPEQSNPIPLTLIEANQYHSSPDQEQFSLIFLGPSTPMLLQSMYSFQHETGETHQFFIVPIGKDKKGLKYEAVFNQVKSS